MKKYIIGFIIGFISAIFIGIAVFLIGQKIGFIPPFKESTGESEIKQGECANINPDITEYGSLKVTLLYRGSPAKNTEVDLALTPGPDNYCYQETNQSGIAEFEGVPIGKYFIYLNMSNFPEEYGIPSAEVEVGISKDTITEVTIELTDYQK